MITMDRESTTKLLQLNVVPRSVSQVSTGCLLEVLSQQISYLQVLETGLLIFTARPVALCSYQQVSLSA